MLIGVYRVCRFFAVILGRRFVVEKRYTKRRITTPTIRIPVAVDLGRLHVTSSKADHNLAAYIGRHLALLRQLALLQLRVALLQLALLGLQLRATPSAGSTDPSNSSSVSIACCTGPSSSTCARHTSCNMHAYSSDGESLHCSSFLHLLES